MRVPGPRPGDHDRSRAPHESVRGRGRAPLIEHAEIPARLPDIHPGAFVAAGAVVTGDVTLGEGSSVWFQTVMRGDSDRIVIGRRSNVQDLTIVHNDIGCPAIVGDEVTIGHHAIIHGCVIEDRCLIGMGAILLGARIGTGSLARPAARA
jgi:carbonic anhydrase/acetyltransferase-like protein (isoleucine patch superfamily)